MSSVALAVLAVGRVSHSNCKVRKGGGKWVGGVAKATVFVRWCVLGALMFIHIYLGTSHKIKMIKRVVVDACNGYIYGYRGPIKCNTYCRA
jgi:hypothetical protein